MNWAGPEFVIVIVAISTSGWVINNWIRARHGYALEDEWGGKTGRASDEATQALQSENTRLREDVAEMEERMRVLERIVTDRGFDVSTQIEALRDAPARIESGSAAR